MLSDKIKAHLKRISQHVLEFLKIRPSTAATNVQISQPHNHITCAYDEPNNDNNTVPFQNLEPFSAVTLNNALHYGANGLLSDRNIGLTD